MRIALPTDSPARTGSLLAIAICGLAIVGLLALLVVGRIEREAAILDVREQAMADADILADGLRAELQKFGLVPRVLAEDLQVEAVLRGSVADRRVLDRRLERIADQTGAAVLYVMDRDGRTLAASNWNRPTSFVGSNYAFRSYFREAVAEGEASQFALGTVSRAPGLYIAQRVSAGGTVLGVVVLKVEFDTLEQGWRRSRVEAVVADDDGIVLIASDPAWRFQALRPIDPATRDAAADRRQYGVARFERFAPPRRSALLVDVPLGYPPEPELERGSGEWRLHLVADTGPRVLAAVQTARLEVLLALAVLGLALWIGLQWHRRREARTQALVAERTVALRDQLTQANRLATLGQVTAGVGHEIRQPLAATRVFAENGQRLLAAGNTQAASENFGRIAGLIGKVGEITDELLRFSRRDAREPREMPLAQGIDGALLLLRDRFATQEVELAMPEPALAETIVRAEPVRLEQVLVNLLQNALDAVSGPGRIALEIAVDERHCRLSVVDDGPGIDAEAAERLFQPFATSKPDGLGLGLVISLDIMRSLGGDLVAEPADRGARFTMIIPRA